MLPKNNTNRFEKALAEIGEIFRQKTGGIAMPNDAGGKVIIDFSLSMKNWEIVDTGLNMQRDQRRALAITELWDKTQRIIDCLDKTIKNPDKNLQKQIAEIRNFLALATKGGVRSNGEALTKAYMFSCDLARENRIKIDPMSVSLHIAAKPVTNPHGEDLEFSVYFTVPACPCAEFGGGKIPFFEEIVDVPPDGCEYDTLAKLAAEAFPQLNIKPDSGIQMRI